MSYALVELFAFCRASFFLVRRICHAGVPCKKSSRDSKTCMWEGDHVILPEWPLLFSVVFCALTQARLSHLEEVCVDFLMAALCLEC